MSIAETEANSFAEEQFKGLIRSRFRGGWSWIEEKQFSVSCPRFRFLRVSEGLKRTR